MLPLLLAAFVCNAYALPTGGAVSAGSGSIAQSGSAMTVKQSSQNLAVNWQSFNVGANESVNFKQPNSSAIALNRVLGSDPSKILGKLNANGQVWVLNPNGLLFGSTAQVNVGGLVASTLNISDADFMAGKRSLSGSSGTVVNQGTINANYVALLGGAAHFPSRQWRRRRSSDGDGEHSECYWRHRHTLLYRQHDLSVNIAKCNYYFLK